jgi:hypothetical protein
MSTQEFYRLLGAIVDSEENAVRGILQARDENARRTALKQFAAARNIPASEQDIADLAKCTYEMGPRRVTIASPRS